MTHAQRRTPVVEKHMSNRNGSFRNGQLSRGTKALPSLLPVLLALPLALPACSRDDAPGTGPSAGMANLGGVAASAGQSSNGGMASSVGGKPGGAGAGGSSAGGASSGSAGVATFGGNGGLASAGSSPGGAKSDGGGASAGGSAGGSSGKGSPGCGSMSPLKSGTFNEMIDGTSRKYVLDVPVNYDPNKKHRLIFVWHPLGGSADGVVGDGYNGLKALSAGSAIFVAADGLNGSNAEASGRGWWNANNGDMKLLTTILAKVNGNLCIDSQRVFSTGFSFGGMMSYTVGYEFDVFRAIAPCSGDLQVIPHAETFTGPLPIMAFHGNSDNFVTTARGRAARDKYLARNQCMTTTVPAAPSPCVQYQGCAAPTFWCEFAGAHNTWSEAPQAIWKFFAQF